MSRMVTSAMLTAQLFLTPWCTDLIVSLHLTFVVFIHMWQMLLSMSFSGKTTWNWLRSYKQPGFRRRVPGLKTKIGKALEYQTDKCSVKLCGIIWEREH